MRGVLVTETRDDTVTWLTQEAFDRLKAELDHLSGQGRIDIAKKIEAAREEGDLRENGGYPPAPYGQGRLEGPRPLRAHTPQKARIGEPPPTHTRRGPRLISCLRRAGAAEAGAF